MACFFLRTAPDAGRRYGRVGSAKAAPIRWCRSNRRDAMPVRNRIPALWSPSFAQTAVEELFILCVP
jgi:hypothetical protein